LERRIGKGLRRNLERKRRRAMKHRHYLTISAIISAVLVLLPAASFAMHASEGPDLQVPEGGGFAISFRGSLSVLQGRTLESAYTESVGVERYKERELDWKLSGINMIGGVVSANIDDLVTANIGLWTAMNQGPGSTMEEHDWLWVGHNWSQWLKSDVDVHGVLLFDFNGSIEVAEWEEMSFRAMAGYKRSSWKFADRAREFVLSDKAFRDTTGSHHGQNLVEYRQVFSVPYLGVGAAGWAGPVYLDGYFALSGFVSARDEDFHKATGDLGEAGTHYEGRYGLGAYVGLGGKVTYEITDRLFASGHLDLQWIPEMTGDRKIIESNAQREDGGSVSHSSTMASASLGWKL